MLANYWDAIHPVLEAEDNYDLTYRENILRMLSDSFLADLRSATFGNSIVAVTGRQIELARAERGGSETDSVVAESKIRAAVMAEKARNPKLLQHVLTVRQATVDIEGLLSDYFSPMGPDLSTLHCFTESMRFVIQRVIESKALESDNLQKEDQETEKEGQQTEEEYSDEFRQEAMRVLKEVGEWLDQSGLDLSRECRRAKRLKETNFIELARILMPDRIDRVRNFLDQVER